MCTLRHHFQLPLKAPSKEIEYFDPLSKGTSTVSLFAVIRQRKDGAKREDGIYETSKKIFSRNDRLHNTWQNIETGN